MKTIDGKRIEELRIGQTVYTENGVEIVISRLLEGGGEAWLADKGKNWRPILEISTTKPRKKALKMLYCFRRIVDGKLCWELEDEIIDSAWERVPENDFEAEIFE